MSSAGPAAPPDPERSLTGRSEQLQLDPASLDRIFAELADAKAVVAAVSGGPDSTALLHALARWAREPARPAILVATVDHGLRPESRREAEAVSAAANRLGLAHHRLSWTGTKPATGVQEAARKARYGLLAALARQHGASHLVTAHTLDDQAETVLMRLARGSGLAGLGGMRRLTETCGLLHLRPFLDLPKVALVAACEQHGWTYHDDPSNLDPRFARSRWRRLMPLLAQEGLDAAGLARFAERVRRADEALEHQARTVLAGIKKSEVDGASTFDARALAGEPFEIVVRVLVTMLEGCPSGDGTPIRLERVEACARALVEAVRAQAPLRQTLAGRLLSLSVAGELTIMPEPPRRRGRPSSVNHAAAGAPHSLGKDSGRT